MPPAHYFGPQSRPNSVGRCVTWLLAGFCAVGLTAPLRAEEPAAETACALPAQLAEQLLAGELGDGDLTVDADFVLDEKALLEEGRHLATVEARLDPSPLAGAPAADLCFFLLLDADGEALLGHQYRFAAPDFATIESVRYVTRLELPQGTRQITAIFRETSSGSWGAAPLESPADQIAGPSFTAVRIPDRENTWYELKFRKTQAGTAPTSPGATPKPGETAEPTPPDATPTNPGFPKVTVPGSQRPGSRSAGKAPSRGEVVIRLVPPRDQPVSGSTVFNCLVTSEAIDRVVFEVDGKVVDESKRKPFRIRLPLASPAREQTVKATAYDKSGQIMGVDSLQVNASDAPFRARITRISGDPHQGSVELEASVNVPQGARLAKLEVYRNEELIETLLAPPFKVKIPTPTVTNEDFVRIAATLEDGNSIDDVELLASPGAVEEVEVNLVELHVVVSDRDGRPITNLQREDFRLNVGGVRQEAQGFAVAQDVPLALGLVVDSSGSMELLMHDTRKAAAKFLGRTLSPKDQAFLVDFDLKPRLLRPITGDLRQLLLDLQKINADGRTAMYDAVVFSLLQFPPQRGRRAIVILSDGDDLDSRFGPSEVAAMAREAGTLIYIIGLGALDQQQRAYSKSDLRKVTEGSGGQLFFVDTFEELDGAYEAINRELRSQYTLSFYTEGDLTEEQKKKLQIEIPGRKDLVVRAVVGAGY